MAQLSLPNLEQKSVKKAYPALPQTFNMESFAKRSILHVCESPFYASRLKLTKCNIRLLCWICSKLTVVSKVKLFQANFPFLYPLKTSEKQRSSNVFRGVLKLTGNGLTISDIAINPFSINAPLLCPPKNVGKP